MMHNALHPEPQKGVEPLTAGAVNLPSRRIPSGEEGSTGAFLRASTPEEMQKCDIEERTKSEREISGAKRPRGRSSGPVPAGYLSEADLAARWSRSTNTLVGWRTRRAEGRTRIPFELIGGVWCYSFQVITAVEADPAFAWIRPADQRGTMLLPLPYGRVEEAPLAPATPPLVHPLASRDKQWPAFRGGEPLQPELPLVERSAEAEALELARSCRPRGFKSITIVAGYALAIAADDQAYFASVLGGLEFITWKPVAALPPSDTLLRDALKYVKRRAAA
jgi:hypothetical protein